MKLCCKCKIFVKGNKELKIDYTNDSEHCYCYRNPEPDHSGVTPSMGNAATRVRNLDIVLKNIKAVYEVTMRKTLFFNSEY